MAANFKQIKPPSISAQEWQDIRRLRRWPIVIAVLLVLCTLLVGVVATGESNPTYCESLDYGECNVNVKVLNDTNTTYMIKQCGGDISVSCRVTVHDKAILPPGMAYETNATAENDSPQPWIVVTEAGNAVGCINLEFHKSATQQQPAVVPLSRLASCKAWQ